MNVARAYLGSVPTLFWSMVKAQLNVVDRSDPVQKNSIVLKSELTDEELVALVAEDLDQVALGVLYDRHGRRILNRAWGMVGEKALAEDLTHDVFLKLYSKASKYKQDGAFTAWFNVLSYNVIIDELRRRKRMRVVELDEDRWQGPAYDDGVEELQEKVLLELQVDRLKTVMARLTEDERILLIMKYQDGMSVQEVAGFFGIGVSAVKMRLMRTREKVIDMEREAHGNAV
ncbi:MAG TPA: RNA polymerase sigma factor [Flavobacteriales bacterium]|jgi:RNA polymerase sigma factor (sigma-70 family)|nr:RNA polymerase sigma factor [Flavobacteriales bacterium]MBP9178832.1 RNA polymerase sigma factor [Flavobacteriales bacterium]HQW06139.1 RNA polymerase sigma factor [Flavobacteriales bacterium]HQY00078.1 RNA polymerase sigma factor [Flavobacteriales bacterium]